MSIINQLFDAVQKAVSQGWSINRIAADAGIPQPSLQDWYTGKRKGLSSATIDALASHFEMRLTVAKIKSFTKD